MLWKIRLENQAKKELDRIPEEYRERILTVLPQLAQNPFVGKKLKGEYDGCYSYRVWPYRIIYRVYKSWLLVAVIHIGHRQSVY
jgi:mRNA interferase RelE/StbE